MGNVKPPIVKRVGKYTITDHGIRKSRSWPSGANWLQELTQLLQAGREENSLQGRWEELRRILNSNITICRTEAVRALMILDEFMYDYPTERESQIFLRGIMAGEFSTMANVLPHEQDALIGKRMRGGAATSRAKRKKPQHSELRSFVQNLMLENPKMSFNNARVRAAKKFVVSEKTVYRATKNLKKKG